MVLLVFTQTDINKFFSPSRDFRGGGGLRFSQLGPGLVVIFAAVAATY